jgi:nucleotide-binding universal stress UspA family protein
MLRSILVALDDTPGAIAARDHAIALARRTGAGLTAAVVLDRPNARSDHEVFPAGGGAFKARRDAARSAKLEAEAAAALTACTAAADGTPFAELRLEQAPEEALLKAGATHDLIVIGRDSTLGLETNEDGLAPVIADLLHLGARPLLVIPPDAGASPQGPVLVGYDGSLPAMAALQLFALLGLAEGAPVRVASAADTREEALALAAEGVAYLRRHGLDATPLALLGDRPADLLLAELEGLDARLLVVGAFEESGLVRMLIGSATTRLLREARVPVFIHR